MQAQAVKGLGPMVEGFRVEVLGFRARPFYPKHPQTAQDCFGLRGGDRSGTRAFASPILLATWGRKGEQVGFRV